MNEIIEIIQSNPITVTIFTIILTVIGLLIAYNRFVVADKSFELAKSNFENSKSKFNLYLEDSFRVNLKGEEIQKIILFNIRINNFSSTKNTFKASLNIEYYDQSKSQHKLKIKHQPELYKKIPQDHLTILDKTIRIEEKDIKSGWLIFEQPKSLRKKRIEKYSVLIEDSHKNHAIVEAFLIKDIIHEK